MPRELSGAEEAAWNRYNGFGTPDEIQSQISKLRKESAKYRTRVGELEEAAKGAPAVPEGGRILSRDEAAAFTSFEALKLKPDAIQAVVTERDALKGHLDKVSREAARDAAAKTLGIEGEDLAPFNGSDTLTYEVRAQEVERNGKKEKVNVAYVKDAEGREHQLSAFGKEKWGRPFEAVLDAATNGETSTVTGTRYTVETGNASGRTSKPSDDEYRKATDNTVHYAI